MSIAWQAVISSSARQENVFCTIMPAVRAAVVDYYEKHNIPYDKEKFKVTDCEECEEGRMH